MKIVPKQYYLNYAFYCLIVAAAIMLTSFVDSNGYNLSMGYGIVSFLALIILGHYLAKQFSKE